MLTWLESHENLAGWAQFAGAMLAFLATYFTVFIPIWHRKRQLQKSGRRLLLNGYEVIESCHRTTPNFLPVAMTLRGGSILVGAIIDEIDRFPIYELDQQGSGSVARNLIAQKGNLIGCRLIFDDLASKIGDREATLGEREMLLEFLAERLEFARKIITGEEIDRPVWASPPNVER